jgi:hypothetical protein
MFESFQVLAAIQLVWFVVALRWYVRRHDEVPLLATGFLFYVAAYRYYVVSHGLAEWANITNFGFEAITNESALAALRPIVLGETILLGTYMACQNRVFEHGLFRLAPANGARLKAALFFWAVAAILATLYFQKVVNERLVAGESLAFSISAYLYLFPMVLSSMAVLIIACWKFGALRGIFDKLVALALMVALAHLSYSSSQRFKFLSWILVSAVIVSFGYAPLKRAILLTLVLGVGMGLVALAGAMRGMSDEEMELPQGAWERFVRANDANMLDGFVLLTQVYPARLEHSYGGEHYEILLRPIPRAWWPNKPVGGYMNKLRLITRESGGTLGISPTLFGSFYQEASYVGIVLLSVVYGAVFAGLMRYGAALHPVGGLVVRGVICASIIPLLRGGDLPGVYAWIGMTFWPILLLLWFKHTEFSVLTKWFEPVSGSPPPPVRAGGRRRLPRPGGLPMPVPAPVPNLRARARLTTRQHPSKVV